MMDTSFPTSSVLYTVGHSSHAMPLFLDLLRRHDITAIADVRSSPYSQFNPQFNREVLEKAMKEYQIAYVFMGHELGARRSEGECYVNGKVRFDLVARSLLFQSGLQRIRKAVARYRLALMCAEKDPITCHRTILVCRQLRQDLAIQHILEDGRLETQAQAEQRLLELMDLPPGDLFRSPAEMIEQAYDIQGEKIAYAETTTDAAR